MKFKDVLNEKIKRTADGTIYDLKKSGKNFTFAISKNNDVITLSINNENITLTGSDAREFLISIKGNS